MSTETHTAADPLPLAPLPPLTVQPPLPLAFVRGEAVHLRPDDLYIPPDALEVLLEAFEGPLDFLLYLIRKHKFDIVDLPVNEITRQYMDYIDLMQGMNFELASEYLVMAAMLAEIKSRLLLPRHEHQPEAELDPRAELIRRLQEYEQFKQAATDLDAQPRQDRDFFLVKADLATNFAPLVILPDVSLADLVAALADVAKRVKDFQHHHISKEKLSTRERMSRILEQLKASEGYLVFEQCFSLEEGRAGVVVSFLAILELVKEKLVLLDQVQAYGQIHLKLA
ncbi:segregation and condensation protein A [Rheinheimera sp. SA_1]|uniref:segregation and condensation protein A n=1 Tax=Rheinheimera sp. SA_1 TaxID=1827365 RepID=UPI000800DBE4|nr:segregation/condensation protein A [Rheinheimera sp. SA_1]OBP15284.1 segregation and condensation protein A [Rheinheimera sp. SA_1]